MNEIISVILVNYNGKEYNDKCIESVLRSTVSPQIQVVVVDNASTDNSLELLREKWGKHDQVHIIPLEKNYGFAKANNIAIEWAREQGIEYFLLLNNDTEIKEDAIEKLLFGYKKQSAIVVPKILYADHKNVIWCAGGKVSTCIKKPKQIGLNEIDRGQYEVSRTCDFANGCCVFLSEKVISEIGLLNEDFFLYYEDTEYSLRAKREGIKIWYCHEAVIYHKVNGSTKGNEKPDNAYYITRNWLKCNRLHMGMEFYLFCIYFLCNRLVWGGIWLAQGKKTMVLAMIKGIQDYLRGIGGKYIVVQPDLK